MDADLLVRIDEDPETRQRGRSAFMRAAAELYLAAKKRRQHDEQIKRAYESQTDAMLEEIEDIMSAQVLTGPMRRL